MEDIQVSKSDLLRKLKANRWAHQDLFLRAQRGYREAVIKELERILEDARAGHEIIKHVSFPEPVDHTAVYDRVIAMLEWSVDETIYLSEKNYYRYVMDEWEWSETSYIGS